MKNCTELDFDKATREAEERALAHEEAEGGKKIDVLEPSSTLNDLNARLARSGLRTLSSNFALSYYRGVAEVDPKLALAAVRIDLEAMIDNLLAHGNVAVPHRLSSIGKKADLLLSSGFVTPSQHAIYKDILPLANAAVHGREPSLPATLSLISAFGALLDDFAAWVEHNVADRQERP